jgi:hypothetical protein
MMLHGRRIDLSGGCNDLAERDAIQAVAPEKPFRSHDDGARARRIVFESFRHYADSIRQLH